MTMLTGKQPTQWDMYQRKLLQENRATREMFLNYTNPSVGLTESVAPLKPFLNENEWKQTVVAMSMKNFVDSVARNSAQIKALLTETSRGDLPTWVKNGLGLIAATYAEDLLEKICSVQPSPSRQVKLHFMDVQTEKSKGNIGAGHRIFDALRGYSGEESFGSFQVKEEPVGSAGSAGYTGTAQYRAVIPGSFELIAGAQVVRDNMNGGLVGDVQAPSGSFTNTINYITGAFGVNFAVSTTDDVVASYMYNIEAATELARYGIQIRSITLEAQPRALEATWSYQAVNDFMTDFGINLEPTLIDIGGKIIQAERFQHVSQLMLRRATGGALVFDNRQPTGISYREHLDSYGILLSRLQNSVWSNTQKVRINVGIVAPEYAYLIQHTPGYSGGELARSMDGLSGPVELGTLNNHNMSIVCDPNFTPNRAVFSYKGKEIINSAVGVGMYIPLYTAQTHSQGFRKDTALLSEYAVHILNDEMLATGQVINL